MTVTNETQKQLNEQGYVLPTVNVTNQSYEYFYSYFSLLTTCRYNNVKSVKYFDFTYKLISFASALFYFLQIKIGKRKDHVTYHKLFQHTYDETGQAVSCPLITQAWDWFLFDHCFPCQYQSPSAPYPLTHSLIQHQGYINLAMTASSPMHNKLPIQ
jgi:hypothetical protein